MDAKRGWLVPTALIAIVVIAVIGKVHSQQQQERELAKPDLPLELSFKSKLFAGHDVYFLHVRNASHAVVTASLSTVNGGIPTQARVYQFPADREVTLNDARFTHGDKATFASPAYRPLSVTVQ